MTKQPAVASEHSYQRPASAEEHHLVTGAGCNSTVHVRDRPDDRNTAQVEDDGLTGLRMRSVHVTDAEPFPNM